MDQTIFRTEKYKLWNELKAALVGITRPRSGKSICTDVIYSTKQGLLQPITLVKVPKGQDKDELYLQILKNRLEVAKKLKIRKK